MASIRETKYFLLVPFPLIAHVSGRQFPLEAPRGSCLSICEVGVLTLGLLGVWCLVTHLLHPSLNPCKEQRGPTRVTDRGRRRVMPWPCLCSWCCPDPPRPPPTWHDRLPSAQMTRPRCSTPSGGRADDRNRRFHTILRTSEKINRH